MDVGPWKTRANKVFTFVVRSPTAAEARRLARDEAGGEEGYAWLEEKFSACTELEAEGEPRVIIRMQLRAPSQQDKRRRTEGLPASPQTEGGDRTYAGKRRLMT